MTSPLRPPIQIGRGEARDAAANELRKAIYHRNDPSLVQRAFGWALRQIGRALNAASGVVGAGGWFGLTVILVVLAILVGLVIWRIGSPSRARAIRPSVFGAGPIRGSADHDIAAIAAAADGRWVDAVQERFRAIVRNLEERDLIATQPGRTADEAMVSAAAVVPSLSTAFRAAADAFDDVTYGERPADAQTYDRLTQTYAQLRVAGRGALVLEPEAAGYGVPR